MKGSSGINLNAIQKVYFIGVGGIGMSALARYFLALGKDVAGYDKTETELTRLLENEGVKIHFSDDISLLMLDADLVVYTPAIPKDHKELNYYRENSFPIYKRAQVLGLISKSKFAICVAGSHGKTTVSSMIAHVLTHSDFGCSAFLGGIAVNYDSNFLLSKNDYVVIEADEFDRSFHELAPKIAVVTAVDTDHLDIYGSKDNIDDAFVEFTKKIDEEGFLVIKESQSIESRLPILDKAFYSLSSRSSDVYCSKYWIVDGGYVFNISYYRKEYVGFKLKMGGLHNIENAMAAFTVAKELKIETAKIKSALESFKGIKRRFERVFSNDNFVFIDDYAHHPQEIRALIQSVKELYPEKKITAIFQPHLFSRTQDLAAEFAHSLSDADEVLLMNIYPARELPIEGVSSELIRSKLKSSVQLICSPSEILQQIQIKSEGVILTIGAGDIDRLVQPIADILKSKNIS
jgi:UDP-N-acetylmuramate--alanine ligase